MDISNLTVYKVFPTNEQFCESISYKPDPLGGWVKFEDVMELLKQSNNSHCTPLSCTNVCEHGIAVCLNCDACGD